MLSNILKYLSKYKEITIHVVVLYFYFGSINVDWTSNWMDRSIRPFFISPLTIFLFPIVFYFNAFFLIPKFLKGKKWYIYFSVTGLGVLLVELIRAWVYFKLQGQTETFLQEFMGSDSLIFGSGFNSLIFCFIFSFAYRFSRDWIINNRKIEELNKEKIKIETQLQSINEIKEKKYKESFSIKKRDGNYLLKIDDILYFKAQGDFVIAIDSKNKKHTINSRLKNIESLIDPNQFFKINRSEIVNKSFVDKYKNYKKNRLEILFSESDDILYTSNSRAAEFKSWFGR